MNSGFIHVISKMLNFNEEYTEAKALLEERIGLIRKKIRESSPHDVFILTNDLCDMLIYRAEVAQGEVVLDEMELALSEALLLMKFSEDKSKHRVLNITSKLGRTFF